MENQNYTVLKIFSLQNLLTVWCIQHTHVLPVVNLVDLAVWLLHKVPSKFFSIFVPMVIFIIIWEFDVWCWQKRKEIEREIHKKRERDFIRLLLQTFLLHVLHLCMSVTVKCDIMVTFPSSFHYSSCITLQVLRCQQSFLGNISITFPMLLVLLFGAVSITVW